MKRRFRPGTKLASALVAACSLVCAAPPARGEGAAGPAGASPEGRVDHAPHFEKLPSAYYDEYDREKYAPCFECHDPEIVEKERTGDTGFRDRRDNLHFRHVVQKKGLSCRACHDAEKNVKQEMLMREQVPFGSGNWQLPIKYTRLEDGGTCVVGCHKSQTYKR